VGSSKPVLTVPDSAVIDTGTRRLVLVQRAPGRFEPREVTLGARSDALVEVLQGLREGEEVVVAANFLIDAESNLKAVISGMAAPAGAASGAAATAPAKAAGVSHQAVGSVDSVDAKAGTVTLNHEAGAGTQVAGHDHGLCAGQCFAAARPETRRAGEPSSLWNASRASGW
jgi:hypothetical protein